MSTQPPSSSLLDLEPGTRARVVSVTDPAHFGRKMLSMGLRSGSIINVLHKRRKGIVISNGPTRIALDNDMANKLQIVQLG